MAVIWFALFILVGAIATAYHRNFKIFLFGKAEFENLDIEMLYRGVTIAVVLAIQFYFLIKFFECFE